MKKHFRVEARTLLHLGRESIRDPVTAVVELVKNSYDADASCVTVELSAPPSQLQLDLTSTSTEDSEGGTEEAKPVAGHLRITDNGKGMDDDDLIKKWLVIGVSSKRAATISSKNRRVTGEKGIGRLSCDRLGPSLELRSTKAGSEPVGLSVDWRAFERQGVELRSIEIPSLTNTALVRPEGWPEGEQLSTGTQLDIGDLRSPWPLEDVESLRRELSALLSPWKDTEDFRLFLETDVEGAPSGEIVMGAGTDLVADVDLNLRIEEGHVTYVARSWDSESKKYITEDGDLPWSSFVQQKSTASICPEALGTVSIRLMFVPRRGDVARRAGLGRNQLAHFLDKNTGVRVYRDQIRVRPYGDVDSADGDWLGLADRKTKNPAGPGRPDFRVSPGQVVGAVFIGRDTNPNLTDTAGREGLLEGSAFSTLRAAGIGAIRLLESRYHEYFKAKKKRELVVPEDAAKDLSNVVSMLKQLATDVSEAGGDRPSRERLSSELKDITKKVKSAQKVFDLVIGEAGTLRGLSTIGIASSVFGHEIRSAVSQVLGSAATARAALQIQPPKLQMAETEVGKIEKFSDRLDGWASFALSRVRRDKRTRRKFDVSLLVAEVVDDMKPMLASAGVDVELQLEEARAFVFAMDVEAVLVNLLTNAYSALRTHPKPRIVKVVVQPETGADAAAGVSVLVEDSGPGIPREFRTKIWTPLFTTKVDDKGKEVGTGLGLWIVESIIDEARGTIALHDPIELSGASFRIWIPAGRSNA